MRRSHRRRLGVEAAEGVEKRAVHMRIDHGAVIMLAVDLDQRRAELAQERDRDRLVVDEGAAAAIAALDAAEDEVALRLDAAVGEKAAGGMVGAEVEDGGDVALLGAVADERAVAAATKGEGKRIEEDRLAGAGLAGEHGQAAGEIDVEAIDEDDVTDREGDEHGLTRGPRLRSRTSR